MTKVAVVTFTDSYVLPIRVEFPNSVGNYKTIEYALTDIKLFKCIPMFK